MLWDDFCVTVLKRLQGIIHHKEQT